MIGVKIRNIQKTFGSQVVLRDISLDIEAGEMIAIVGPSGTGKSVMLKIITGLMSPDSGEVYIGDECMTVLASGARRQHLAERLGVLFQGAALLDSMTLYDNLAFPLRYRGGFSRKEIQRRCFKCLGEVGLIGYENALPGEVSIGIKKRLGIARALITEPDVILFDEPNTGLDPEAGQEIYDLIKHTKKISGCTGIVISHEIPEVFQVCDRVVMLYQGMVEASGSIDEFLGSKSEVVQQFVKGSVEGPIEIQ
ncbi:MAG: ATP-binding cassette domain-containing protein [bacterium]|nr:ATP-binding cassette domain-containing protein [bacterium]